MNETFTYNTDNISLDDIEQLTRTATTLAYNLEDLTLNRTDGTIMTSYAMGVDIDMIRDSLRSELQCFIKEYVKEYIESLINDERLRNGFDAIINGD